MAKNTVASETRKLLAGIKKGKITLKKASILIEDLEIQMAILLKEVEDCKVAHRELLKNSN